MIKSGFINAVAELMEQGITDEHELYDVLKDGEYPSISGINVLNAIKLINMGLHKEKEEIPKEEDSE